LGFSAAVFRDSRLILEISLMIRDVDLLRDDQRERLKEFVPGGRKGKRGPRTDNRRFLNALLWMTVALTAHGLSPAIGFIHKSPRWPLSYDAIELLRPRIERMTFDFIDRTPLSPRDFIVENGTHAVKTARTLTRRFLGEASPAMTEIDKVADWMTELVEGTGDGMPL
jgi:hypothetical protein